MDEELQPNDDMTGETNVALQQAGQMATTFLGLICKPAATEIGLGLQDKVKVWRLKNQIDAVNDLKENLAKKKIAATVVHPNILFPWLDAVQFEDDSELRKIWVNLMTNYVDPKRNLRIKTYPSILKELSTPEVNILEYIYHNACVHVDETFVDMPDGCIENLTRLNLIENYIEYKSAKITMDMDTLPIHSDSTTEFYLTKFGRKFVEACDIDKNKPNDKVD